MFLGLLPDQPRETGEYVNEIESGQGGDGVPAQKAKIVVALGVQKHGQGIKKQAGEVTLEGQKELFLFKHQANSTPLRYTGWA